MADMADDKRKVVVTDVKGPFGSMVVLMARLAVAAIPALIVLLVIGAVASTVIAGIFGDVLPHWGMNKWWAR